MYQDFFNPGKVLSNPSSKDIGVYPSSIFALAIVKPVFAGLLAGWVKVSAVTLVSIRRS